ncbi:MAG: hypothetical protein JWO48_155 [Bryobacterales bacterium]|nr:hypothetical protein [Bryobacterales bacterium]
MKYAAGGPLAHARGSATSLQSTILLPSHDREGVVGGLFQQPAGVLNRNFIEEFAMWGGPPGPRPTPTSASVSRAMEEPDQGVRRGRRRPPHRVTQGTRPYLVFVAAFFIWACTANAATYYLTVAGLGGEPDYEQRFAMWAGEIEGVLRASGGDAKIETLKGASATRAQVRSALENIAHAAKPQDALVVMLIGHGSFDGFDYKINLPGPDLSGAELASLLDRVPATRQLVVNMTSASGGAVDTLRKENRVVITATKTGTEHNATVFPRFWVEALRDPAADTDKNETISALEAFHYAQHKIQEYYDSQKRIATEHALLEDTGKTRGVRAPSPENNEGLRAAAFPLVRLGAAKSLVSDPEKRKLFEKKDQIEQQIDELKYNKATMAADEYKKQLTALLLELARTQEELDK